MNDQTDHSVGTDDEEVPEEAGETVQEEEYHAENVLPMRHRVRHWLNWRNVGIICALGGIFTLIGGNFAHSPMAMEISAFFILSGAIMFTVGVIGSWITRQRPLD